MYKKILFDFVLNIVASILPLFILQFFILPKVAVDIGAENYGVLISIIAFINLTSSAFGSTLNNSRLITYNTENIISNRQDHNRVLIVYLLINSIIVYFSLIFIEHELGILTFILVIITSNLMLLRTYNVVEFRIILNYKKIFLTNLFLLGGYIIGFLIFKVSGRWIDIYFYGILICVIFIWLNIKSIKTPFQKNNTFNKTFKHTSILLVSGFLASTVMYVDKILIYPLLGGFFVTIYYVSTLISKTFASILGPINSVLLSYFSKMNQFRKKHFIMLLAVSSGIGILSYIVIILVSEPLLIYLYPQYVEESMEFVPINTLTVIIITTGNVVNTVILKFRKIKWQVYINLIYTILYITLSVLFLYLDGLYGFCFGVFLAAKIRLLSLIILFFVKKN